MPSTQLIGQIRTYPWGGDDLHSICLFWFVARISQLVAIVALMVYLFTSKRFGERLAFGELPPNCNNETVMTKTSDEDIESAITKGIFNETLLSSGIRGQSLVNSRAWLATYTYSSFVSVVVDLALIFAIWTASSIGTPTEPKGRNKLLRSLLLSKFCCILLIQVFLITLGISLVAVHRSKKRLCDNSNIFKIFENTSWYKVFCVVLVCQVMELYAFIVILFNHARQFFYKQYRSKIQKREYREQSAQRTMSICCQCCRVMTCFMAGGNDITKQAEFADVAQLMIDYMDAGGLLDVVFTDLYVGFKLLLRIQRQRRLECLDVFFDPEVQQKQTEQGPKQNAEEEKRDLTDEEKFESDSFHRVATYIRSDHQLVQHKNKLKQVVLRNTNSENAIKYQMAMRSLLCEPQQKEFLHKSHYYAHYANAIYLDIKTFLIKKQYIKHRNCYLSFIEYLFNHPATTHHEETITATDTYNFLQTKEKVFLDSIGLANAHLSFVQLKNGMKQTPYCVIVDEDMKAIVLSIRGSASLEDVVVDMQLDPMSLEDLGGQYGFDAVDEYAHRGVAQRALWIHEHIKEHEVLQFLLKKDSKYKDYNLVITGHSLGAGCAAILALLNKKEYPSLKCFGYCPPGGLLTYNLAYDCKDYVHSFVHGSDIIPRMSLENLERLRNETLEIISRISIPKIQCLKIMKEHTDDDNLLYWNNRMLYPRAQAPHTKFNESLIKLREYMHEKKAKDKKHALVRLYPPGEITYLLRDIRSEVQLENNVFSGFAIYADNEDFDEILITKNSLSDHSILKVIDALQYCKDNFDEPFIPPQSKKTSKANTENEHEYEYNFQEGLFICSKPHGNRVFVNVVLCTLAFAFSTYGNNHCDFVVRHHVSNIESLDVLEFLHDENLNVGLWAFMKKERNGADLVNISVCSFFPKTLQIDGFIIAARTFSIISGILGLIIVMILWFTSCMTIQKITWQVITGCVFFISLLEALMFLFIHSNLCNTYVHSNLHNSILNGFQVKGYCTVGQGGAFTICAIVLWLLGGFTMLYYPKPLQNT